MPVPSPGESPCKRQKKFHDHFLASTKNGGGQTIMEALKERCSTKAFGPEPVPREMRSSLLRAADGVNRQDSGKRTQNPPLFLLVPLRYREFVIAM